MYTDLIAGLSVITLAVIVVCPFVINRILKFKVEIEKLRLENELKKEEIRARNQFDIEKMLKEEKEPAKLPREEVKGRFYEGSEEPDGQLGRQRLRE